MPVQHSFDALPPDARMHGVSRGALLLSREFALFCRVPTEQIPYVQAAIDGKCTPSELPDTIREALIRHGFAAGPRPSPAARHSVQLQLTNDCNLHCEYCCTNSGKARPGEVTHAEFLKVVSEARATLGEDSEFGILGGEPFLVSWAIDLIEYITEQGSPLTVFSNGTNLGDATLCNRLAAAMQRGTQLRISLAGVTPALCDSLSGAARFESAISAIHALAERGALPQVDVMLLPQHVEELTTHLPKLRRQLPEGIPLSFGILYRSGRERGAHVFQSRRHLEQALDRIVFEAGETIRATAKAPLAHRREGCSCALGHHLHVRSDGQLFSCFKMDEPIGDLRQESFAEVARASQGRARPACTLPICAECTLNTLCGGGCRSENHRYTGSPNQPVCGEWRKRVCYELLAEDLPAALEWPVEHLLAEAKERNIPAPGLEELLLAHARVVQMGPAAKALPGYNAITKPSDPQVLR
jgi:radical SAM protein with 4Fe4S-binding SPASM domain